MLELADAQFIIVAGLERETTILHQMPELADAQLIKDTGLERETNVLHQMLELADAQFIIVAGLERETTLTLDAGPGCCSIHHRYWSGEREKQLITSVLALTMKPSSSQLLV